MTMKTNLSRRLAAIAVLFGMLCPLGYAAENEIDLKQRVADLEAEVAQLRKQQEPAKIREENKQAARIRGRKDREIYSSDQLKEIESLYQVANKNWRSPEAIQSLETLVKKFDKANRTGCAVLYLGQMSKGEQRLKYLQSAVKNFSDCYYYDGCQVGGYARLVLAATLMKLDRKDDADKLLAEIRKDFPNATDHRGRQIASLLAQDK